jgi:hypothetical protein
MREMHGMPHFTWNVVGQGENREPSFPTVMEASSSTCKPCEAKQLASSITLKTATTDLVKIITFWFSKGLKKEEIFTFSLPDTQQ